MDSVTIALASSPLLGESPSSLALSRCRNGFSVLYGTLTAVPKVVFDRLVADLFYKWFARGLASSSLRAARFAFGILPNTRTKAILWVSGVAVCFGIRYYTRTESYAFKVTALKQRIYDCVVNTFSTLCADYLQLRKYFRGIKFGKLKPIAAHSHPDAASNRSVANDAIDNFIARMGFDVYSVSPSNRDIFAGNDGIRSYYTAKDTSMISIHTKLTKKHIIKMVDVDYYANIPYWASFAQPMLLYTFVPTRAAGKLPNGQFCIVDDVVRVQVDGGAIYEHMVWDFNHDNITFDYWNRSITYLIETIEFKDDMRRLVLLTPTRIVYGVGWTLPGPRLQRMKYNHHGVNVVPYMADGKPMYSLAHNGGYTEFSVEEHTLHTAYARRDPKKANNPENVSRIIFGQTANVVGASTVLAKLLASIDDSFFQAPLQYVMPTQAAFIPEEDLSYSPVGSDVVDRGRNTIRCHLPPLLDAGTAPTQGRSSDENCVLDRIELVRNTNVFPREWNKYMEEFAKHIVPQHEMHTLTPYTYSDILAIQNRPSQVSEQQRIETVLDIQNDYDFRIASFQKNELYGKIQAPRNITTVPTVDRVNLSCFTLPFAEVLKKLPWYVFGRHPTELSHLIHERISRTTRIAPTDLSRYDGTGCPMLAQLETMIYKRAYPPTYHAELDRHFQQVTNKPAKTRYGIKYNTGSTTLSGRADTSQRGTLGNAFADYIHHRLSGKNCTQAWAAMGLYGGDDGISCDPNPEILVEVYSRIGFVLKVELVSNDAPFRDIKFLGRIYLDPWTTPSSIIDVKRQLSKIHLTTAPASVPLEVTALRKVEGLLSTDPRTPLLSSLCRAVQTKYRGFLKESEHSKYERMMHGHESFWAKVVKETKSPFIPPDDDLLSLANAIVDRELGIEPVDRMEIELALSVWAETSMDDHSAFPVRRIEHEFQNKCVVPVHFRQMLLPPTPIKEADCYTVVHHGNVVTYIPKKVTPTNAESSESVDNNNNQDNNAAPPTAETPVCRHYLKGRCTKQPCRFYHPPAVQGSSSNLVNLETRSRNAQQERQKDASSQQQQRRRKAKRRS